jgi:hypothetical protein
MTHAQRGVEQLRGLRSGSLALLANSSSGGPLHRSETSHFGRLRVRLGSRLGISVEPHARRGSWCPACVIEVVAPRNHRNRQDSSSTMRLHPQGAPGNFCVPGTSRPRRPFCAAKSVNRWPYPSRRQFIPNRSNNVGVSAPAPSRDRMRMLSSSNDRPLSTGDRCTTSIICR